MLVMPGATPQKHLSLICGYSCTQTQLQNCQILQEVYHNFAVG